VLVLNRNNSENRLIPVTARPEDDPLIERLEGARPDSCAAARLARPYERGTTDEPLLECELCGVVPGLTTCTPSLVGGEVIVSVLVRHVDPLATGQRERVNDSVSQAAPVLANLRNLAVAEARATSDMLTGLPNTRAARETLKRVMAQASRGVAPLSVVMFDLDRFKQINDTYGHGRGDDVLAAVGSVVRATLRASDFAARFGGEEFLVLLPDTDRGGAVTTAEKLRQALSEISIPLVERAITASFGVATFPADGADEDTLVRAADHALYDAKAAGRDRVHVATAGAGHLPLDG